MTTLVTTLTAKEIDSHLESRPDWKIERGELIRTFTFETFPEAISFVDKVAALAEEAGHHPDIDIRYNKVKLALVSHDAPRSQVGVQPLEAGGWAYSARSSLEIPDSGFGADSAAWCSFLRVFLYHHAPASPPASTDTAATAPSFSQPSRPALAS